VIHATCSALHFHGVFTSYTNALQRKRIYTIAYSPPRLSGSIRQRRLAITHGEPTARKAWRVKLASDLATCSSDSDSPFHHHIAGTPSCDEKLSKSSRTHFLPQQCKVPEVRPSAETLYQSISSLIGFPGSDVIFAWMQPSLRRDSRLPKILKIGYDREQSDTNTGCTRLSCN